MRSSSSSTGGTRARGRSSDSGRRARSWLELRSALSGVFGTDLPASAFDESQPIDDAESTLRLLRALLQGAEAEQPAATLESAQFPSRGEQRFSNAAAASFSH